VTTEDDFQRILDENPADRETRLVFADWLQDRGDPRAEGYRAMAVRNRHPLQGRHLNADTWWWHACAEARMAEFHNHVPQDWFGLLPPDEGSTQFWPVFRSGGGVKTRRECEDALALAFAKLTAEQQAKLLTPFAPRSDAAEERGEAQPPKETPRRKPTS
jgi:uncharacterized protein (TIGR02996 family)